MLAASTAPLGSWTLFPNDAVGMWAGYWVLGVVITAFSGGVFLLLGAVREYPTAITRVMVAGGAGIVLGAVLQAGNRQQSANSR